MTQNINKGSLSMIFTIGGNLKKKTYIFDGETLQILEEIKLKLGKKETQILKEAIMLYHHYNNQMEERISKLERGAQRMEEFAQELRKLSIRLERCEEMLSSIQKDIARLSK